MEWKNHDGREERVGSLSKSDIVVREGRLAVLLNHSPKPGSFRTLHCSGYFGNAEPEPLVEEVGLNGRRLGLIFERPKNDLDDPTSLPVSLKELNLDPTVRKAEATSGISLASTLGNCLLYLNAVNELHKNGEATMFCSFVIPTHLLTSLSLGCLYLISLDLEALKNRKNVPFGVAGDDL
jgi:hypothetical protein